MWQTGRGFEGVKFLHIFLERLPTYRRKTKPKPKTKQLKLSLTERLQINSISYQCGQAEGVTINTTTIKKLLSEPTNKTTNRTKTTEKASKEIKGWKFCLFTELPVWLNLNYPSLFWDDNSVMSTRTIPLSNPYICHLSAPAALMHSAFSQQNTSISVLFSFSVINPIHPQEKWGRSLDMSSKECLTPEDTQCSCPFK